MLTFTTDQLAVLDRALVQLPYGQVAPLIHEINRQLAEQKNASPKDINQDARVAATSQEVADSSTQEAA